MSSENAGRKRSVLIVILVLITVIAVGVSVWALWFRPASAPIAPDYAPREEDKYAESMTGGNEEKLDQPEGGGAVGLIYTDQVTVDLSENMAGLLFGNPSKSNQDMVLQLVIRERLIFQTGTLKPGNQITQAELSAGVGDYLSAGVYDGKLVVYCYDPASGERAVLNTEIPAKITVTE